jgi:hypothetical protein
VASSLLCGTKHIWPVPSMFSNSTESCMMPYDCLTLCARLIPRAIKTIKINYIINIPILYVYKHEEMKLFNEIIFVFPTIKSTWSITVLQTRIYHYF